MDLVLEVLDPLVFDSMFDSLASGVDNKPASLTTWPRHDLYRQAISIFIVETLGGYLLYFSIATLSYFLLHDAAATRKHPRYLPNQVLKEISLAVQSIPVMSILTLPLFLAEVRGYSMLYRNVDDHPWGWTYLLASIGLYLFFTDMLIYWIHRGLHHPSIYSWIHKPHHRWIVSTPFASHAFSPLDGCAQASPYHLFVFLFPMHSITYLCMFVLVNIWTISIHDGVYATLDPIINSAAHHTLHHLYFNFNYGQYFTLWDRIGGTYRKPDTVQDLAKYPRLNQVDKENEKQNYKEE